MHKDMCSYPKVSIMIPTYNQARYIENTVKSALMQDYPNLEVIVSDDCSTDETSQLMQQFQSDSRFRYCKSDVNRGRVANYHHTLYHLATGDWVINLDGDDYYTDEQFISRSMMRILRADNVVCYFARRYISPLLKSYKINEMEKECYCFNGKEYFKNYFEIGGFAHLGTFYRRDIALQDGKCYTLNELQSDFHGIIRYCVRGNVIVAKETGYKWRVHESNATQSLDFEEKMKRELLVQKTIMQDLSGEFTDEECQEWLRAGERWARRNYVSDCLHYRYEFGTLLLAARNFRFSWSYCILVFKNLIATVFDVNLFR